MQTYSFRLAVLASLLFGLPGLSWAKPVATPPGVVRAEQAGAVASTDPFSPVNHVSPHQSDVRPLQLPPPPVGGLALPRNLVESNAPIVIGTINGETLVQTSAGVEVLSKAKKQSGKIQYQRAQRN
ncbi:hypothetical protein [Acidithiobacillus thiooxidans]|uniref:hypothetical protein n=1 Tax=Acidithiobacillus thiooxidans TaxID=930 RepID=UPI0004E143F7|nr:hypothetical protein [Acidithiobacillus thiooxidans]